MNTDERGWKKAIEGKRLQSTDQKQRLEKTNDWDTDKLSAAAPQPKKFYWTQMNTDKHRKGFMKNA